MATLIVHRPTGSLPEIPLAPVHGGTGTDLSAPGAQFVVGAATTPYLSEFVRSDVTTTRTGAVGAEITVNNTGTFSPASGPNYAGIRFKTSDTGVINRSAARILGTYLAGTFADTALIFQTANGSETFRDVITLRGPNTGFGTFTPGAQVHIVGLGQNTQTAFSTTGALGGTLYLQDSGALQFSGGGLMFGAGQGAFAVIKGLLQNGATNTTGDISIATRRLPTDATLTNAVYITQAGQLSVNGLAPAQNTMFAVGLNITSLGAIMADFIFDTTSLTGDSGTSRFVARQLGAGNTQIRAVEAQTLRSTGASSNFTWGIEVGVHSQVAGDQTTKNLGIYIASSHSGWLASGVRNDTALYITGEDGWYHAIRYIDTNGTVLFDVDQGGKGYFAGNTLIGLSGTAGGLLDLEGTSTSSILQILRNTNNGVAAYAEAQFGNDAAVRAGIIQQASSTFTGAANRMLIGTIANGVVAFLTNSVIRATLDTAGQLGLGMVPTVQLDLSTDGARKLTTTTWSTGSDARIKTDIRSIDDALEIIGHLRPVKYRYTTEFLTDHPSVEDIDHYNFIAQEYQHVFPGSVTETDGLLYLNNSNMIPYAIAGIKALHQQTAELLTTTQAQQERLHSIEARLLVLEHA